MAGRLQLESAFKRCQSESEISDFESEFRKCTNTDTVFGRTIANFVGQCRVNTVTIVRFSEEKLLNLLLNVFF